ncbi:MAG: hypothetical protein S4CHLAM45_03160 [Chlamydiales bacterium]|nr:hypothetical protein [Chlamydiales bacterium]MCH9619174.1 hypothetical protein [Chlamydiales bacterium]MCH9622436.1 hypothetical protein [Chlamydiales bacterium]
MSQAILNLFLIKQIDTSEREAKANDLFFYRCVAIGFCGCF